MYKLNNILLGQMGQKEIKRKSMNILKQIKMDEKTKSWTIKKAECQRIDAFGLWCWRRLLRVSWTARRSNQSVLTDDP